MGIGIETDFALKFLVGKQEKRDHDNDDEEKDGNENERSVTFDNFALPRQCNYCYQGRTTPEFYFYFTQIRQSCYQAWWKRYDWRVDRCTRFFWLD